VRSSASAARCWPTWATRTTTSAAGQLLAGARRVRTGDDRRPRRRARSGARSAGTRPTGAGGAVVASDREARLRRVPLAVLPTPSSTPRPGKFQSSHGPGRVGAKRVFSPNGVGSTPTRSTFSDVAQTSGMTTRYVGWMLILPLTRSSAISRRRQLGDLRSQRRDCKLPHPYCRSLWCRAGPAVAVRP
jgi:hypothetical protein